MANSHGELNTTAGTTAQVWGTAAVQMTGFDTEGQSSDELGDLRIKPDLTNDKIIVTQPGFYLCLFSMSAECDIITETWTVQLHQETVAIASMKTTIEQAAADQFEVVAMHSVIEITAAQIKTAGAGGVDLTIYGSAESDTNAVTAKEASFTVIGL
jgi:hypothetical protein